MMGRIEENTVDHWCTTFVDALANPAPAPPPVHEPIAVSREPELRPPTPPLPHVSDSPAPAWGRTIKN
jgi:hypothetical protein